jgi:hypothetical protein
VRWVRAAYREHTTAVRTAPLSYGCRALLESTKVDIRECYCGIDFTIRENGVGSYSWEIHPPPGLRPPRHGSTGTVSGGQNEAILAARRAIRIYLEEPPRKEAPKNRTET